MEEKPVRKTDRAAVASLCLGLLAFLSSFLFFYMVGWISSITEYFPWQLEILFNFAQKNLEILILLSSLIALAALATGINAGGGAKGRNRMAWAGILLGVLSYLGGFPMLYIMLKLTYP